MARKIASWMRRNDLHTDSRIYFNDKAWDYDSSGNKTTLLDIKATDYFEYGNNDTISISFEGGLYRVMNYHWEGKGLGKLHKDFHDLVHSYGYYAELGNAWNLALYKIEDD